MAARRISGTVIGEEGPELDERAAPRAGRLSLRFQRALARRIARPDGTFLFEGIPPGQYVIDAIKTTMTADPSSPTVRPSWSASLPVVVGTADIDNLRLALRSGPRLTGRFVFDGTAAPPDLSALLITVDVRPESADGHYYHVDPHTTMAGAAFTVTGLVPGRYVLRPPEQLGDWQLRAVTVEGRDVSTRRSISRPTPATSS